MKKIITLLLILFFLVFVNESNQTIIKNQEQIINFLNQKQIEKTVTSSSQIKEKTMTARVTAYAPLDNKSGICADSNPAVTSTGYTPKVGICAVNPAKIPYGSLIYIPSYGYAIAQDTGAAMRNYDGIAIDVVMETYEEAMKWGVRYLEIQILN